MKMKYLPLLLLFTLFTVTVSSQNPREEYIRKYQLLAIEEMNRSGIPASIKMAQACLESADGRSQLANKSNNHFGIKCKSNWTGSKVFHDDDYEGECFRKYNSVEDSYRDHTDFLMNSPRYASLFKLDPTDYKSWAQGLKKAGYATASHYDKTLIKIIEDNKLHRLDYRVANNRISVFEQRRIRGVGSSNTLMLNPFQSHPVIKMNGINAVAAKNGDSYEMIAQEFGLKNWEIYKYNDQKKGYFPQANEVVYINNKSRKTSKNVTIHRAQGGETMHFISQMYGIQLRPLLKRNNMKMNEQPVPGQIIQLRDKL
jgi:LysM repeat protein